MRSPPGLLAVGTSNLVGVGPKTERNRPRDDPASWLPGLAGELALH